MRKTGLITAVLLTVSGCSTSASRTLPLPTLPSDRPDTGLTAGLATLALRAGQFRYDMLHNATLQVEGEADTLQSLITTRGVLVVDVTDSGDSTYMVTVSADSLRLDTQGPAPSPTTIGPIQIGPILQAIFGRTAVTVENQLADSLCSYGQLLSTARELLVPQLPTDGIVSPRANTTDTAITTVCRAGARITSYATRDLTDTRRQPQQFVVRGRTELAGMGVLRKDSVAVTGSLTSKGNVFFRESLRLPQKVETEATGKIRVQVGDSTTVFRQITTQVLELRPGMDSLQVPPQDQPTPAPPPN